MTPLLLLMGNGDNDDDNADGDGGDDDVDGDGGGDDGDDELSRKVAMSLQLAI